MVKTRAKSRAKREEKLSASREVGSGEGGLLTFREGWRVFENPKRSYVRRCPNKGSTCIDQQAAGCRALECRGVRAK